MSLVVYCMKNWLMFLFLAFAVMGFVSGSVVVHNYSVGAVRSPFEVVSGDINLTIVGEDYEGKVSSNDGDEIALGDFLNASGVIFDCSPPDCSRDYSARDGVVDKSFDISVGADYFGFVLNGEDVVLDSLSFEMESDFGESVSRPLSIEFFEGKMWRFSKFSGSLLSKNWGCYDEVEGTEGSLVGVSPYCEMISIPDSDKLRIGAKTSGSGAGLNMTLYPESGTGGSWRCSYVPSVEDGCDVSPNLGEIFSAGNYQVCVGAGNLTGYKIYNEAVGENCGFVYTAGPENSTKDYAIFAQGVKYADANSLGSFSFGEKDDEVVAANELIQNRYGGDCSGGCILPLKIFGISQGARIYDVRLEYTAVENALAEKIYDLDVVPVKVDFNGSVDLGALDFFVSKSMNYVVSFNGKKLFEKVMTIFPVPFVNFVFPMNPPAGVPIRFFADVNFSGNGSLSYTWDFGDGGRENTNVPYVVHSYDALGNYSLEVEVGVGGNLSSKRSFDIVAISPEVAVDSALIFKRGSLKSVKNTIFGLLSWYGSALADVIGVDFFESELDRLEKARNNSFSEAGFVKIAKELYALEVPVSIFFDISESPFLVTELDDINIEPVAFISGNVSGDKEDYKNPILVWQEENVAVKVLAREVFVSFWSGEVDGIFRTYSIDVDLKDGETGYFVINRAFDELHFNGDVGAKKAGDATVVVLDGGKKVIEFYYKSSEPTSFFVSPRLSSLVIDASIDETCNYNRVCEEGLGENFENCRSDCKPTGRMIFYIVLVFVFALIIYTVLQIWYKRRYEGYLFKDGRQLYNLLMFVTNARARGMMDDRIAAELRAKGWSSERVNYIIKKSRGRMTGLPEIIPIEKVFAFFRNRAAAKRVATGGERVGVVGKGFR